MLKKTVLSILFLLLLSVSHGQSKNDKQLERILDGLLSDRFKPNDPGCAVLVAKKGRIVYEKAFGSADLELKVAARPDMIFRLGSISKQFTAVAI
ncbi:MAG TPA: serine hydrolase domain-containing protein, partial [Cyclobacteriaceae bacterium]|nr:serine hydrolase domain-containing protein [Cyclobacteriaceae bacterium]